MTKNMKMKKKVIMLTANPDDYTDLDDLEDDDDFIIITDDDK